MEHSERGDIILGWLARVALVLVLLGVISYDALAVGVAKVSVADQASSAARAASLVWVSSRNPRAAYDAAARNAIQADVANTVAPRGFRVDPDGTVRLRVDRPVHTLLLDRIPPLRGWAVVGADGVATTPS